MSITLRKRKNNDGSTSLVLDIYHNGKRSYEFLKELKLLKPSSPTDREENKQRVKIAEQIRNKKEQQLQSEEYDITPDFKKGIDFIQFFSKYVDSYSKKDKRVMTACLGKFKEFMDETGIRTLTTKRVTETLVMDFKEYLQSTLNGESPANYFSKFKRLLKHGVREKIFNRNPADEITISKGDSIKKDILTAEEIQKLASISISNRDVKMAFLFCCNTGLRFCDVSILKWKHIKGDQLKITQVKTGKPLSVNLNENAFQILEYMDEPQDADQLIFNLPSHNACLKNLKAWCNKGKIKKHVTWHVARHTFGTNMVFHGADVNTASSNLGHTSLSYTQRYLRAAESLKQRAVDNLPKFELTA